MASKRQAWWTGAIAAVVCGAGCGLLSGVDFGEVKPRDAAGGSSAPGPCDPDAQAADGIFVSAAAGSDEGGDGTQDAPLETVQAGIDAAIAEGKGTVYLDEGTYEEAIAIPDSATGLSIEGGWVREQGGWVADCAAGVVGRTVIAAPSSAATVVQVLDVQHSSALVRLTLTTKDKGESQPDRPGESLTGVFVKDSLFQLTAVDVKVGDGGDGGLASAGAAGADGASRECNGSSGGDGENGSSPAAGAAARATGTFTASGYTPADGSPGRDGEDGHTGTPPGPPDESSDCNYCGDCEYGCPTLTGTKSGGWGSAGCGGEGGKAGAPGRGGGASVALMAVGAGTEVRVDGGVLHARNGGDGSAGGAGGPGGPGTYGTAGSDTSCPSGECSAEECTEDLIGCSMTIYPFDEVLAGGSAGGPGGAGGKGSNGGAGAGGPSYAVVKVSGASVTLSATTKRIFGQAGKGGGTAPSKAADGAVGEELEVR